MLVEFGVVHRPLGRFFRVGLHPGGALWGRRRGHGDSGAAVAAGAPQNLPLRDGLRHLASGRRPGALASTQRELNRQTYDAR